MKFSLLPLSILVSTVIADGASIIAAIEKISNATVALNTTVATFPSSFLGGAVDVVPLLVDSTALLDDINSGTYVASSSANLSLAETISVAGATTSLVSTVESVLDTVVAAKAKFDKLLIVSPVILVNLKLEKAATDKFSAAVISKVPTAYQALAQTIIAPVDVAFDNAIADYE